MAGHSNVEGTKITVDLGNCDLMRRIKMAGIEEDMTMREIVVEAVRYWLGHREEIEDTLATEKLDRVHAQSSVEFVSHDEVKSRLHSSRQRN